MSEAIMSKAELLERIHKAWADFHAYLKTLSEAQLTGPIDAAGWTVKDHVMHMVVWEDSMNAMLEKRSRREQMGVPKDIWDSRDFDKINETIRQQHLDKTMPQVLKLWDEVHQGVVKKIEALADEDLARPYHQYQADSDRETAIIEWLTGDTFEHYIQHTPWIAAIVA